MPNKPNCIYYDEDLDYCRMACAPADEYECDRCPLKYAKEATDADTD